MSKAKRIISLVLALVACVSLFGGAAMQADAAGSWPGLSASGYCEYTAVKQTNVFRDSGLGTRGTSNPAKSYNAYISKGDVCHILKITANYIQISYPTSSGYRTGFVKRSDLIGVSAPGKTYKATAKETTYVSPGGASYGYIASGDTVYECGSSNGYTCVIYTAKSGNRAFKLGWTASSNAVSSGSWQWPVAKYRISQSFGHYSSAMNSKSGRPYHSGVDMVSTNSDLTICAAAAGTVKYKGSSSGNGLHVILQHTLNGKTVYTLYSHLKNYSSCPAVGKTVAKGQKIGVMGSTGNSTGVHLHFGVFAGGYSSDPYGYTTSSNTSHATYKGITYYNPAKVISTGKLP